MESSVVVMHEAASNETRMTPESWEVWTYGLISVTTITAVAIIGIVILPRISKRLYHRCLALFVGLGVGTLTGSAVFHLIPQCFDIVDEHHTYLIRALTVICGVYLFYFTDKFLKVIMKIKKEWKARPPTESSNMAMFRADIEGETELPTRPTAFTTDTLLSGDSNTTRNGAIASDSSEPTHKPIKQRLSHRTSVHHVKLDDNIIIDVHENQAHGICNHDHDIQFHQGDSVIATVAWMIIFGDGLHNFIDGLSIGAAYTQSVLGGLSITVAVLCEEFPHELGDVAILLNAGMSLRQALTYNLLSAVTCYIGFVVGVLVGELQSTSAYIFGLAAGMFLYIGLASMVPEMNATLEHQMDKAMKTGMLTFLLQSVGVLSGLALMYFFARYGGEISFE